MADNLKNTEKQPALDVTLKSDEINIPDFAVQRFARFLLPRLQADLDQQEPQNKAG